MDVRRLVSFVAVEEELESLFSQYGWHPASACPCSAKLNTRFPQARCCERHSLNSSDEPIVFDRDRQRPGHPPTPGKVVKTGDAAAQFASVSLRAKRIRAGRQHPVELIEARCDLRQHFGDEPMTMDDAIEAIRREDYDKAIEFFGELAQKRPEYHVGLLRLGHAQREKAVRMAPGDPTVARDLLETAITNLEQAAHHREVEYQAQAIYKGSKAHYHMGRLDAGAEHFEDALSDARRACDLHGDPKYQTWLEHLERLTQRPTKIVTDTEAPNRPAASDARHEGALS